MIFRVLLAGVLGGALMFGWQFVAHMYLPLGEMGMSELPSDAELQAAVRSYAPDSGLYFFPKPDEDHRKLSGEPQQAAMKKHAEKIAAGPSGLLVVTRSGAEAMSPRQLGVQFGINVAASILASLLLATAVGTGMSYFQRIFFVTLLGFLCALVVGVPQHNWYNFPAEFTLGQVIMHTTDFLAAGILIAALIRRPAAVAAPRPM